MCATYLHANPENGAACLPSFLLAVWVDTIHSRQQNCARLCGSRPVRPEQGKCKGKCNLNHLSSCCWPEYFRDLPKTGPLTRFENEGTRRISAHIVARVAGVVVVKNGLDDDVELGGTRGGK